MPQADQRYQGKRGKFRWMAGRVTEERKKKKKKKKKKKSLTFVKKKKSGSPRSYSATPSALEYPFVLILYLLKTMFNHNLGCILCLEPSFTWKPQVCSKWSEDGNVR